MSTTGLCLWSGAISGGCVCLYASLPSWAVNRCVVLPGWGALLFTHSSTCSPMVEECDSSCIPLSVAHWCHAISWCALRSTCSYMLNHVPYCDCCCSASHFAMACMMSLFKSSSLQSQLLWVIWSHNVMSSTISLVKSIHDLSSDSGL